MYSIDGETPRDIHLNYFLDAGDDLLWSSFVCGSFFDFVADLVETLYGLEFNLMCLMYMFDLLIL